MPSFTPPTVAQSMDDHFWGRYSIPVGQSVVKVAGTFTLMPFPWIGDLEAAGEDGTDYFLGGRTYPVTDAIAEALDNDGFGTGLDYDSGYGEDEYSEGEFGQ